MPADPCPHCLRPLASSADDALWNAVQDGAALPAGWDDMDADHLCWSSLYPDTMCARADDDLDTIRRERDDARAEATALRARLADLTAPADGVDVDVEEVLRLDREATPGPWRAVGASIRVTLPGGIEYQWATASYPRDTALIATYRTAAPALAREVVRLRDALGRAQSALGGEIELRRCAEQERDAPGYRGEE